MAQHYCHHCRRLMYPDKRSGTSVWRHYWSDSEFCHPDLSVTEAFGTVATLEEGDPGE